MTAQTRPTEVRFVSRSRECPTHVDAKIVPDQTCTCHVVTVRTAADGSEYLQCTCPGGKWAFASKTKPGVGCWAMREFRATYDVAEKVVRRLVAVA